MTRRWALEYQHVSIDANGKRRPDGDFVYVGIFPESHHAWRYMTLLCLTTGLDFFAAVVRAVR